MYIFNKIIAVTLVLLSSAGFTLSTLSNIKVSAQSQEQVSIELVEVESNGSLVFEIADQEVVVTQEMQAVIDAEMAKLSDSQLDQLVEVVEEEFATPSGFPAFVAAFVASISTYTKLGFFYIAQVCMPRVVLCANLVQILFTRGPSAVNCVRNSINQRRFAC